MIVFVRRAALVLALAAAAFDNEVQAATKVAPVSANVAKPLSLSRVQDLELGRIVLAPGTWSGATVSISRAGQFLCANPNLTCTGTAQVGTFNLTGTNNQVIKINAPNVTLTNQSDPSQTLTLTVDSPGTITLANAGNKGQDFSLGGSMILSSSTAGGLYSGTFNVTVDY